MELALIKRFNYSGILSVLSFGIGFINLLNLNLAILIERNIFNTNFYSILILSILTGSIALLLKPNNKTIPILGIVMNILTGVTMLIILIFSYSINPSI